MVGTLISKIGIPPGVNKESTQYSAGPSWGDSNNVRFRGEYAESIGGWADSGTKTTYQGLDSFMLGVGRGLFSWTDYSGNRLGSVGTNLKFYAIGGIAAKDITPIRLAVTSGVTFAASAGSAVLTVTHTDHLAKEFDFVIYANAVSLGGLIVASVINGEHQITEVVDANTYKITVSVEANGSDTGNGDTVDAEYQVNVGQADQQTAGGGFGEGTWDSAGVSWDYSSLSAVVTAEMRLVFMDNYNEDLMVCNSGGEIYYYDVSQNVENNVPKDPTADTRALALSSFTGSSETPSIVESFLVSERDGHVIAFGCNDLGGTTQNNLLVRWSDQNNPFVWEPTMSNTSGGHMLRMGSRIIKAISTKSEILIWTNSALYSMRFIGPPDIFSFTLISSHVNIASPMSAINISNNVFFMGEEGFYSYSGSVKPLPSSVSKYVFDDVNLDQMNKTFAGGNSALDEVYWVYPSSGSIECDRYACFNYADGTWYLGRFDMTPVAADAVATGYNRTAWEDATVRLFPTACYLEELDKTVVPPVLKSGIAMHELSPDDSTAMSGAMECYVESGDIDISDGSKFTFISRFIPDMMFPEYRDNANPRVVFTATGKDFPGGATTGQVTKNVDLDRTSGGYSPVGNDTATRIRGRSISLRFESSAEDFRWRLGDSRIDGRPDGGR